MRRPFTNKTMGSGRRSWDKTWPYCWMGHFIKRTPDKKNWIHDTGGASDGSGGLGWSEKSFRTLSECCDSIERMTKIREKRHLTLVE